MLLIDGDVLAHMACPSRWKDENGNTLVMHDKSQKVFSKHDEAKYLKVAYNTLHAMLQNLLDATWETDYLMGMKHQINFRDAIFSGYKKNRYKDTNTFNSFVPIIRSLSVYEGLAIYSEGVEVDDCIGIWATQCEEQGIDFQIATIDKDMRTIPGKHYHMKDKTSTVVTPEQARRFYYTQLLMGDPVDNIPGLPGIGPKKAEAYVKACTCEEDYQETVVSLYESYFKDEWYEYLLSNGKLLHIMRRPDDFFTCRNWEYVEYLQNQKASPFYTPGAIDESRRKEPQSTLPVQTHQEPKSVLIIEETQKAPVQIKVPQFNIPKVEKKSEESLGHNIQAPKEISETQDSLPARETLHVPNSVGVSSAASIKAASLSVANLKVPTVKVR